MLVKAMMMHVLPTIAQYDITIDTFDLYMSITGFNTFALMINFINGDRVAYHVTLGLFEALNTSKTTLEE